MGMSRIVKEDCKSISIYLLREWGYLDGAHKFGGVKWTNSLSGKENNISFLVDTENENDCYIKLMYVVTDGEVHVEHKYPIVVTSCNYGGKRYWFVCSLYQSGVYCGRRVAKLYLGAGNHYFACRRCYGLTYRSRIDGYSITEPDLQEYWSKIKRPYYRDKMTRKHAIFLRKEAKFEADWIKLLGRLGKGL